MLKTTTTRMHSSRMHTVRSSGRVSRGGAFWDTTPQDQAPPPGRPNSFGTRHLPRTRLPRTRLPPEPGTPLGPGTPHQDQAPPYQDQAPPTPPVNRITDTCKNITFATSLRTVNIQKKSRAVFYHNKNPYVTSGNDFELCTLSVADLGFPRAGGANSPGGRQPTILPNFPENCMELKEFGPGGGVQNFTM